MQNSLIQRLEDEQIAKIIEKRGGVTPPTFRAGDTVKVDMIVKDGDKERIQVFEGFCIAKRNRGFNSSFTLRKVAHGTATEIVFALYSPNVAKIDVVRKGKVRRAKIYYIRDVKGKVRITEKSAY